MKIYTRFGDSGSTQLLGGITLQKSDVKIELIGALDELNSAIGLVDSQHPHAEISDKLQRIQAELFEWGAMLAGAPAQRHQLPGSSAIQRLEDEIDAWQNQLPPMTHFILPGGSTCGATLHLTRTICRRVERACAAAFAAAAAEDESRSILQSYLNRLSDWIFVAARLENQAAGAPEIKWQPGQS